MSIKEIKNDFKKSKKTARKLYREMLTEAEGKYRSSIALAEENYANAVADFYASRGKKQPVNPPKRSVLEEIGNSITHGIGALFAIVAFILMIIAADNTWEYVSAIIYSVGMFIMMMSSCLYHAFSYGSAVKRLFHRFDYSSIYLLIGATFAPILLCQFGDAFGLIFFVVQWVVIAAGISLVGVFGPSRLNFLHIPMYFLLGWSALMLLPDMISANPPLAMWILAGGIIYTLGIIPFLIRARVSHFIWHFFVLAGAVVQWVGTYLYLFKNN